MKRENHVSITSENKICCAHQFNFSHFHFCQTTGANIGKDRILYNPATKKLKITTSKHLGVVLVFPTKTLDINLEFSCSSLPTYQSHYQTSSNESNFSSACHLNAVPVQFSF